MSKPHVQIVLGSTREGRFGEAVARWFSVLAAEREDMSTELVDLRDWELPFLTTPMPPAMSPPSDELSQRWAAKVSEGDGYVFVTPEYNHGYPAVLKNALDHVFDPWNRKPAAFVGYGGPAGGVRAVEQLRQVVVELEMVPLRRQVIIAKVYAAFDERGQPRDPGAAREAGAVLDELAWWATAMRDARVGASA